MDFHFAAAERRDSSQVLRNSFLRLKTKLSTKIPNAALHREKSRGKAIFPCDIKKQSIDYYLSF
jgi:hypothetical protein